MTDLTTRAAALLAAVDKMTPEPWSADLMYVVGNVPSGRPGGEVIARCGPTVSLTLPNEANSHGIAALRNEAPALIRELLRAAEDRDSLRGDYAELSQKYFGEKVENERLRTRIAELEAKL